MSQISSSKTQSIVNAVNSNIHTPLIALIALIFENQRQPMTKDAIPYLCGGTFLAQVIRVCQLDDLIQRVLDDGIG